MFTQDEKNTQVETKVEEQQQTFGAEEYLKQVNELKAKTVDKELYEQLKEENRKLAKSIIDNQPTLAEEKEAVDTGERIKSIRQELFGKEDLELNNLEFATKAVELRKLLIENGELDPFLPNGMDVDSSDVEKAENVAKILEELIEDSQGNPDTFQALFQSRVIDITPPNKRR